MSAVHPIDEKPTPEWQRDRNDELCTLYAQGWSMLALADHFGITKPRVHAILKMRGADRRAPGRPRKVAA